MVILKDPPGTEILLGIVPEAAGLRFANRIIPKRARGHPKGMSYVEYFDLDVVANISVDNSPRYETKTIKETDEYRIHTTS